MTLNELNTQLARLSQSPGREEMLRTACGLVEYMGLRVPPLERDWVLLPNRQELKRYLTTHPLTRQHQLYRLTEKGQPVAATLGVLKKFRKDQLTQLIDKENYATFQKAPPVIQELASAPAYYLHLAATEAYDRLYVVLYQDNQKRIITLRNKLTQTQFQKIFPQWYNIGQKSKPEIAAQLWKSLDLKEVNKEFYKQIKEQFDGLVAIALRQYPKAEEREVKQFAVRLIGRYIFCWFLKEKGIIPDELLQGEVISETDDYCNQTLLPLFFNTLNTPVPERDMLKTPSPVLQKLEIIPYLNGGLFDRHPEDRLFAHLSLNHWLQALVKVLENFDFTVDESSTQYQQVAIDPEMLGRVFENLLASQNEETEKLANQRKAYGAFYTPREIVDYMVNESLKAHVETHLLPSLPEESNTSRVEEPVVAYRGTLFEQLEPRQTILPINVKQKIATAETERIRKNLKDKIEKLFTPGCTENPFNKDETQQVRRALSEITVLDPACGSGAFPMGMLLRLMELRQIVGHGHRNNYDLKSEILSKNIFGVDIMPMAVEIARLRAWLSLVLEADYKPADRKNNFGIAALPNLDFKFICANSLIDSGYDAFLEKAPHNATLYRMDGEIQKLERLRESYYDPKGDKAKKDALQKEFKRTKDYIKTEFASLKKAWKLEDFLNKVDDWNPFDDSKPSSFFSPAWMFGIRDGFDVVIGNPPYVRQETAAIDREIFQKRFKSFSGKADLYVYFYEQGINLLRNRGVLCFITSSKFIKASYGKPLLAFISDYSEIKNVINFNDLPVFNGITTYPVIVSTTKGSSNRYSFKFYSLDELPSSSLEELLNRKTNKVFTKEEFVRSDYKFVDNSDFKLVSKIKNNSISLKEYCGSPVVGIKTGFNDAFIIEEDIDNTRPYIFGRDIKKYQSVISTKRIIFPYNADFSLIPFDKLGRAKDILIKSKKVLSNRAIIKDGLVKKTKLWYEYQQINKTIEYSKSYIIFPNISLGNNFSIASNVAVDMTSFILKSDSFYLLAILNSKLIEYLMKVWGIERRGGYIEYKTQYVEKLPIKNGTKDIRNLFIDRVKKIFLLNRENQGTASLEKEIDVMVYKLYDLTYEEVKIIDKDFGLSEAVYNEFTLN